MAKWTSFKVAGVTFDNRLEKISKYCSHGSAFVLERDMQNVYDPNAVEVLQVFKSGRKMSIGYVPKDLAVDFALKMDHYGWVPIVRFGRKFIRTEVGEDGEIVATCVGLQLRFLEFEFNGKHGDMISGIDRDMGRTQDK